MKLLSRIARIRIGSFTFETGDGLLLPDIQIVLGEGERSSTAQFSLYDPGLLIGAEFMKLSIASGGIITPPDLLKGKEQAGGTISLTPASSGVTGSAPTLPEVAKAFEGGANSLIARAVGHSEGNRTPEGGFTSSYNGHTDPGNGAFNIGSFSYQVKQGGASTPAQADELWLNRLRSQMSRYEAAAKAAGLDPADSRLLANFCDLYTQAPEAAVGKGGFLDRFKEIQQKGGGYDAILQVRVDSYRNPRTGALDAPGFGNSESRLRTDQDRRMRALQTVLSRGAAAPPSGNIQPAMAPKSNPTPTPPAQKEPPKEESVKGTEIIIELGYDPANLIGFHFIHTGTNTSKDKVDITSFEGKSVRWLLTRVPQTNSFENVTLKQVADLQVSNLGLKLEMEGSGQKFQHLDLSGKTPFELLHREAKNIGFRIADDKNKLILEPEARPKFTNFVIDEEVLISVKFGDQARAGHSSPSTPVSQSDGAAGETKTAIDRQTGQNTNLRPDSMMGTGKLAGSTGVVTGAAAPAVGGTIKPQASQTGNTTSSTTQVGTGGTPVKGPEIRKTERTEGDKKIIEEVTIERKEELPEKITTTTTTKATEIVITNTSGSKTTKVTVETKVATPTGTTITTKTTQSGNTTETTTTNNTIDAAFSKQEAPKKPDIDEFGLPKQPPGIIDLADGRAEGQVIADESKRVKGYESTAVLLSTEEVLQLVPGEIIAFSPRVVPEPFDREWRVGEVRHDWARGITTINFYTPQKAPEGATIAPAQNGEVVASTAPPGKLQNPTPGNMRGTPFDPAGAIRGRPHNGIDTAGDDYRILAAESGTVTDIETGCREGDRSCGGGFGNLIEITHDGQWAGYKTLYAHLASVNVTKGQKVQKGQVIGRMGNTGFSFGDHLHYEVSRNGTRIDPEPLLSPCFIGVYGQGSGTPLKCK